MKIKLFSPCHTKECSDPSLEMSASTTDQQENKEGKGNLQDLRKKTRRKTRRRSWDLFEIFLMQLHQDSSLLPFLLRELRHLQTLHAE